MIEQQLKDILQKTFDCGYLHIENQSHLHVGHFGSPESGESHFAVTITATDFIGQSNLARHRMVNQAVYPLFEKGLHALSIKASSTED